jgi:hypothetical protein
MPLIRNKGHSFNKVFDYLNYPDKNQRNQKNQLKISGLSLLCIHYTANNFTVG